MLSVHCEGSTPNNITNEELPYAKIYSFPDTSRDFVTCGVEVSDAFWLKVILV